MKLKLSCFLVPLIFFLQVSYSFGSEFSLERFKEKLKNTTWEKKVHIDSKEYYVSYSFTDEGWGTLVLLDKKSNAILERQNITSYDVINTKIIYYGLIKLPQGFYEYQVRAIILCKLYSGNTSILIVTSDNSFIDFQWGKDSFTLGEFMYKK